MYSKGLLSFERYVSQTSKRLVSVKHAPPYHEGIEGVEADYVSIM